MIEVVDAGIGSTFQDLGRPGLAHLGIGHSGALDRGAHRLANRLVGNAETLATIETCGGLRLRTHRAVALAVTGAQGPIDVNGGPPAAVNSVVHLPVEAEVALLAPTEGVRYYVAIRGGFDVDAVLGSRSYDTLAGIGPALQVGATVTVGPDPQTPIVTDFGVARPYSTLISISEGPRRDWFSDDAWSGLTTRAVRRSARRPIGWGCGSAVRCCSVCTTASCPARDWSRVPSRFPPTASRS